MSSKCWFNEFFKAKVALFIAQPIKLRCQLHYFQVSQDHFYQDLFHAVQLDVSLLHVLIAEESEGILYVNLVELGISLEWEDAQEVIKVKQRFFGEQLIELDFWDARNF